MLKTLVAVILILGFATFLIVGKINEDKEIAEYNAAIDGVYTATVYVDEKDTTYYLVDYSLDGGLIIMSEYYFPDYSGKILKGKPRIISGDFTLTYTSGEIKEIKD